MMMIPRLGAGCATPGPLSAALTRRNSESGLPEEQGGVFIFCWARNLDVRVRVGFKNWSSHRRLQIIMMPVPRLPVLRGLF